MLDVDEIGPQVRLRQHGEKEKDKGSASHVEIGSIEDVDITPSSTIKNSDDTRRIANDGDEDPPEYRDGAPVIRTGTYLHVGMAANVMHQRLTVSVVKAATLPAF